MVQPGDTIQPASLGARVFRTPLVSPATPVRETPSASLGDLVRMLAEGIADAQVSLDRASAEMLLELANTKVDIIPSVTETIDQNGNITFTQGDPQKVSLLHLGVRPTFYQFSQAVVEVAMDIKIVEHETENGERRLTLFADTANVRFERKLNRDVRISSKLTATLVPVPMPLRLEPVKTTTTPPVVG
jgi:hypothetical protein